MIDAFPSNPADPDHDTQSLIDADLENSRRLLAGFEQDFPRDPAAGTRALVTRVLQRPRPEVRYPLLTDAADRHLWMMPLLRRFQWNAGRADAADEWTKPLCEMLQLVFGSLKQVSAAEFVALAGAGALLVKHIRDYPATLAKYAAVLEKARQIDQPVVDALRELMSLCDAAPGGFSMRPRFFWPLFRCAAGFYATDESWSARVRRNLAGVPVEIFDCETNAACGGSGALTRKARTAVQRSGKDRLEKALRSWIGMLGDAVRAPMPASDVILLGHVIVLCDALEGPACDQLLYDIACAPWGENPEPLWMRTCLWALGRRAQDKAFACLEALMMNPNTAVPIVRKQYEALLAAFGAGAIPSDAVGVDGFPLDSDPALVRHHTRVDQLLRMAANAAAAGPYVHPSAAAHLAMLRATPRENLPPAAQAAMKMWEAQLSRPLPFFPVSPEVTAAREAMEKSLLQEFADDPADLHRAVVARVEWIAAHRDEYAKDSLRLWDEWLNGLGGCGGMKRQTLAGVDELPLESLLATIRTGGGNTKVLELCQTYVAKHGWHADLVPAFRQWIGRIGNAMSDLTYRWRAEAFLWFENVEAIDLNACWSHRVKRDLRAMPAEEARAWVTLLENSSWIITDKPPMKWLKAAETAFQTVGAANFEARFAEWFAAFGGSDPLRLTIAGRNILRILIWYALVAQDSQVDDALLRFASAKWKTREEAKRAAQAEMAFSYVLSQRAPAAALPILESMVKSGQAFKDSATHRTYLQLCARYRREPVDAIPQKS
jgi:hypothetical protein